MLSLWTPVWTLEYSGYRLIHRRIWNLVATICVILYVAFVPLVFMTIYAAHMTPGFLV